LQPILADGSFGEPQPFTARNVSGGHFPWYQGFQQGKTAFSGPQTPTVADFAPRFQPLSAKIPTHSRESNSGLQGTRVGDGG
jgi:hypothetical protein